MLHCMADRRASVITRMLDERRKSIRWLARQLSERLASPVSHQTVTNWLRGDNEPRDDQVWDLMLTITKNPSMSAKPERSDSEIGVYRMGTRIIPLAGLAYAGRPIWGVPDVEPLEVQDWGGDFDRWGKIVSGRSMSDTDDFLLPGDVAIFENRRAESGHIVHASREGEDVIKYLATVDGARVLRSLNPPTEYMPAEGWEVLGVLVHRIREGAEGVVDERKWKFGAYVKTRHA